MPPPDTYKLLHQEGHLFRSCLTHGLTALRNANDSEKGNFYVAFFQLSIGFERLMKAAFAIHHMAHNDLETPSSSKLKSFQHRLLTLFEELRSLPVSESNPLSEIGTASISFDILTVLDEFAQSTRYFNLDTLVGSSNSTDPLAHYDSVIQRILVEDVEKSTITRVLARNTAIADAVTGITLVVDPTIHNESPDHSLLRAFVLPSLQDIAARRAVYHVIVVIDAFRRFLRAMSNEAIAVEHALGGGQACVPNMNEFLDFAWLDRSYVLRKKRWP